MRGGWIAWLAVSACGGGTRSLDECPGDRPAIADCYVGEFFADCGGTGAEPVLGCNDQDFCYWFTGGCAPDGFDGSGCPADNACCDDGWPFPDHQHDGLGYELQAFGTAAWDRTTSATVTVAVDPSLTASATTITCTPFDSSPNYTPCNDAAPVAYAFQRGTTVITGGPIQSLRAGWYLWIEIVDDGTGVNRARVCKAGFTDLPDVCYPHAAECASSGTVTVNQLPLVDGSEVVADVDVLLGALHVVATLVYAP